MATLLYTPGIRVRIATARNGIVDVSDDVSNGSLSVVENDLGSVSLTLTNNHRKYDGIFTPNDRISIQMKRISWVQVFSGYLNQVPYFSIYPRDVVLTASCTMKRLLYHYWDPGAPASYALINSDSGQNDLIDGGVKQRLVDLMTKVAGWPKRNLHIGAMPNGWDTRAKALQAAMSDIINITPSSVGLGVYASNSDAVKNSTTTAAGGNRLTGALPDYSGKISWFGGPAGAAYGNFALTGESGSSPKDDWYCAMRWPYAAWVNNGIKILGTATEVRDAKAWWKNRKIMVVNTKTSTAVCLRAADWGPNPKTDRVLDMSERASNLLGGTDTVVEIRFAPEDTPLGIVSQTSSSGLLDFLKTTDNPLPAASDDSSSDSSSSSSATGALKGLDFTQVSDAGGYIRPNVHAAEQFIRAAWPQFKDLPIYGYQNRNIAGTGIVSDHAYGLALDVTNGSHSSKATDAQNSYSTSVAAWFIQNPKAFGTKYVIWHDQQNTGKGWFLYDNGVHANDPSLGHFNHCHISFLDTKQTSVGAMGSPWPGSDMNGFPAYTTPTGVGTSSTGSADDTGGGSLINAAQWFSAPSSDGVLYYGQRALINDVPLLDYVRDLSQASMRSFMSAPNGDFIAWFPDFFGTYGTAGVMNIQDIELTGDGFTIAWDDSRLKTHIFATGTPSGFSANALGGAIQGYEQMTTPGVATVESPEIMQALFNLDVKDPKFKIFMDSKTILNRFGARPESTIINSISNDQAVFWYAIALFQRNWASQFTANVSLTFMPELFPGMLLRVPSLKFQAYVTSVSHSFDLSGGGFTTNVTISSPSVTDGSGPFALPKGY